MKIYLYFGKKDKDLLKLRTSIKYWDKGIMAIIVNDMLSAYRNGEEYIFPLQYDDNELISNKPYRLPLEIKKENEGMLKELNNYEINSFVKEVLRIYLRTNKIGINTKKISSKSNESNIISSVGSVETNKYDNKIVEAAEESKIESQTDDTFDDNLISLSGADEY